MRGHVVCISSREICGFGCPKTRKPNHLLWASKRSALVQDSTGRWNFSNCVMADYKRQHLNLCWNPVEAKHWSRSPDRRHFFHFLETPKRMRFEQKFSRI